MLRLPGTVVPEKPAAGVQISAGQASHQV